jgi:hypothetical protein
MKVRNDKIKVLIKSARNVFVAFDYDDTNGIFVKVVKSDILEKLNKKSNCLKLNVDVTKLDKGKYDLYLL